MQLKSNIPIYIQIATDIKEQILSNKFELGSKLPSVREFSAIYEVTALTIQRAMQQLELEGIVKSQKGIGSFVQHDCGELLEKNMIYKTTEEFIKSMRNMGLSNEEIRNLILEVLADE
jgi:GntR family transcriptional regulator